MTTLLCITLFGEICGSSRIRVLQFIPYLEKNGITCVSKRLFSDNYFRIIANQKRCNRVVKSGYSILSGVVMLLKKIKYALIAYKYDVILIQKDAFQ